MTSKNRIYDRIDLVPATRTLHGRAALLRREAIANLFHSAANVIRRGVERSVQGTRRLIEGMSRSPARPQRRYAENPAGKSGYDVSGRARTSEDGIHRNFFDQWSRR